MRTFKHRKTGEIITYNNGVVNAKNCCIELGCEPPSKFWEEVVKDYEILSFKHLNTGDISSKRSNGLFLNDFCPEKLGEYTEDGHNELWVIHSVKQLPTNEVFTVGDKCRYHLNYDVKTITGFTFRNEDDIWVQYDLNNPSYGFILDTAVKCGEPLWTTEDGVGVYEGDDVAWVIDGEFAYTLSISTGHTNGSLKDSETYKVFSTVEKAIEYVESIKTPILTTFDGVKIHKGDSFYIPQKTNKNEYSGHLLEFKASIENTCRPHGKTFADKTTAKKYIKENQKRYSLNDIKEVVKKLDCFGTTLIQYLEDGIN